MSRAFRQDSGHTKLLRWYFGLDPEDGGDTEGQVVFKAYQITESASVEIFAFHLGTRDCDRVRLCMRAWANDESVCLDLWQDIGKTKVGRE